LWSNLPDVADRKMVDSTNATLKTGWATAPYRDVLNNPGIARAHDMQRLVSYGVAVVISFVVRFPGWRGPALFVIAAALFIFTLWRLAAHRKVPAYALAQSDLLLAGIAIAIATASVAVTVPTVVFIAVAIAASFRTPRRVAIVTSALAGLPPIAVAFAMDSDSGTDTTYVTMLVLIAIALTLAAVILAVFAGQPRQLQKQLQHRESQLEAILNVTPVVLAAVDEDGTLTTLAGSIDIWDALSGQRLPPESPLATFVSAAHNRERAAEDISIGDRAFNVICDPGSRGEVLLTIYEVTERTVARLRLEEVVRSKDQFIAAVSHELRTPLASVVGFSELIRERMTGTDPLEPMVMEVADQSAEMAAIIDDLLIAARASFESVPTEPREINLAAEAAGVIETMGSRLEAPPERQLADVMAFADPIRVRQIIRNLLTNADRYGGARVEVATSIQGDDAVLVVKDSGEPLPAERRELIFEPYESSGPVRGQPAAIGLWLAVSRTLAELMGGAISYDHDGEWSLFELRLPRRADGEDSASSSAAATPEVASST
jgi:signal transduction histidine kinase